jgi:putative ABC transport system substrate-binding protein
MTEHRWARLVPVSIAALLSTLALAACGGSSGDDATTASTPAAATASDQKALKVGVLEIAPADVIDDTVKAYQAELRKKLAPREVSFNVQNAQGKETLIQNLARNFSRSDDDVLAVIGTPAVIAMAKLEKQRPVIAIAMGDPVGGKVAKSLDAPGGNVTGSIDFIDPGKLLDAIGQTQPAPKRIGTIYDPANENSQVWVKALKAAAGTHGMTVAEATIASSSDVNAAARSLAGKVDALLIGPDATVISSLPPIASVARSHKLPLYLSGGDASAAGVVASLGPDYPTIGRATADVTAKVVAGASPATVPFAQPTALSPQVNAKTVAALGLKLPAAITAGAS